MIKTTTLISMPDFVLEHDDDSQTIEQSYFYIVRYAHFLKRIATPGIFIPCNENNEILVEPVFSGDHDLYESQCQEYAEAEARVLFEGFSLVVRNKRKWFATEGYEIAFELIDKGLITLEKLVDDNIPLTTTGQNIIYNPLMV